MATSSLNLNKTTIKAHIVSLRIMAESYTKYNENTYRLLRGLRRTNPELDPSFTTSQVKPQQKRRKRLIPVYENAILAHCIIYGEFWYSQVTGHEIVWLDDDTESDRNEADGKDDGREAHDATVGRGLDDCASDPDDGVGDLYTGVGNNGLDVNGGNLSAENGDLSGGDLAVRGDLNGDPVTGDLNTGVGGLKNGGGDLDAGAGDPDAGAGDLDVVAGDPDAGAGDPDAGAGAGDLDAGDPDAGAGDSDAGAGAGDLDAGDPDAGAGDAGAGAGDLDAGDPDAGAGDAGAGAGDLGAGDPDAGAGDAGAGAGDLGAGDPDAGAGDAGAGAGDLGAGDPDAGAGDAGAGAGDLGAGDPDAGARDPDADAGDPDAGVGDTDAGAGDSIYGAGNVDLNVDADDPDAGNGDLNVDAVDPDADAGDPDAGAGDPDAGAGEPINGAGYGDLNVGAGDPDAGNGDLNVDAGDPDAGAGDPDTGNGDLNAGAVITGDVDLDTGKNDMDTGSSLPGHSKEVIYTYDEYCIYKKYDRYQRKAVKMSDVCDIEAGSSEERPEKYIGYCAYKKHDTFPRKAIKKPSCNASFKRDTNQIDVGRFATYPARTYRLLRGLRRTDPYRIADFAENIEIFQAKRPRRFIPIYSQPVLVHCIRYGEFLQWKVTGHELVYNGESNESLAESEDLQSPDITQYEDFESQSVLPVDDVAYRHYKKFDTYEIIQQCTNNKGLCEPTSNSYSCLEHAEEYTAEHVPLAVCADLAVESLKQQVIQKQLKETYIDSKASTAFNEDATANIIVNTTMADTRADHEVYTKGPQPTTVVYEYRTQDEMAPVSQQMKVDKEPLKRLQAESPRLSVTDISATTTEGNRPPVASEGFGQNVQDDMLQSDEDDDDDFLFGVLGVYARGQ